MPMQEKIPGFNPYAAKMEQQKERIKKNLSKIKYKIGVMSGKGGVGKTTVSVNLACGEKQSGFV